MEKRYMAIASNKSNSGLVTRDKAIAWAQDFLNKNAHMTEIQVVEITALVRRAVQPIEVIEIPPTPTFEKRDHDYSNEKFDEPVGKTHIGEIGAGYDFPTTLTNGG